MLDGNLTIEWRGMYSMSLIEISHEEGPNRLKDGPRKLRCSRCIQHTSSFGISTSYSDDLLVEMCFKWLRLTFRVRRRVYSPTVSTGKDALLSQPPFTC